MRIDLSQLTTSQMVNDHSQKVEQKPVGVPEMDGSEDRTTFKSDSASVSSLVSQAMNSPEIRQDRVDQLKQAISGGQYKLDPRAIADAMIDEHA